MTRTSDIKGFSLIETLVSMAIFSVGLLGLLALQITAIQSNANARRLTSATILGQSLSDYLEGLPFNDPELNLGSHPQSGEMVFGADIYTYNVDETGTIQITRGTTAGYQLAWTVTDSSLTTLKTVAVTVTWLEPITFSHSVSFYTYRAFGTYD